MADTTKDESITFRVDDDLYQRIKRQNELEQRKLADTVRRLMIEALNVRERRKTK